MNTPPEESPPRSADLLSLPYQDRQTIIVVENPDTGAAWKNLPLPGRLRFAASGVGALGVGLALAFGVPALIAGSLGGAIALAYLKRARYARSLRLVGREEANQLEFPLGPYRLNTAYTGHPWVANLYYPTAVFHRETFLHKLLEAVRLLESLGATEIRVEGETGSSEDITARLQIPSVQGISVEARGGKRNRAETGLLLTMALKGTARPRLATGLAWYEHEETWKTIAEARLKSGLESFDLRLTYEDDFGVTADFIANLQAARIGLGGQVHQYQAMTCRMSGKFAK